MGIIKILDESVANIIAAGEVVENPASLIKELLENSLDAESKLIKIDVKNGGKNIKFTDDGKGMSREDLLLCIERHATSKISTKEDLFNLCTYGFRGEALSSIASVAKMVISTKRKIDQIGNSINILGGKITYLKEIQKSCGTEIDIKDLFFNTPARLKFLRKDTTENTKIKEIVLQEALANPNVSIILSIDGKEAIRTSGKGIENCIVDIFGGATLKNLKKNSLGYIGNLSLTRSTKDFMFIFVNGRPVKVKIIEEAIIDAYYTHLMKGKYPFAIIDLKVNPKTIDVNVHPSKKIIKFSKENEIYHEIYDIIETSLNFNREFSAPVYEIKKNTENIDHPVENKFEINEAEKTIDIEQKKSQYFSPIEANTVKLGLDITNNINSKEPEILNKEHILIKENKNLKEGSKITKNEILKDRQLRIIGQYSNSFILVEENGALIIYDQHIVHERILYEKFKKDFEQNKIYSQSLLVPIKIILSPKQIELFKEKKKIFDEFGFEIDEFNDKEFLIRAVPNIKTMDSFENIFFTMLLGISRINSRNDVIEKMIISMACHGAIKANEKLSIYEMEKLILELHKVGRYTCPHGRPITFKISLLDMEKEFKRK